MRFQVRVGREFGDIEVNFEDDHPKGWPLRNVVVVALLALATGAAGAYGVTTGRWDAVANIAAKIATSVLGKDESK